MNIFLKTYEELLNKYGPQGWWPITVSSFRFPVSNGHKPISYFIEYHPSDFLFPKNEQQRFEICIGAVLTQNASWKNAEKAILNLVKNNSISPEKILRTKDSELASLIKSAGYFNQKARKMKIFSEFYLSLEGKTPKRKELLDLWGIGKETADSILLYAYNQPYFIIDAYTRRLFSSSEIIQGKEEYDEIRKLFELNLPNDYRIYQEYHALIVEHGKKHFKGNVRLLTQ